MSPFKIIAIFYHFEGVFVKRYVLKNIGNYPSNVKDM